MRTFTYSDTKSHKFWNIDLQGSGFTVTYGRQGTAGQTQTKTFADAEKAQREHDKLVKEKLAKGYVETTPSTKPTASLREALEKAVIANPDDLASHMAYADYLAEENDPRGEFMQVQIALEDPQKPAAERKKLQKREKELLKAHGRTWLGELAPYFLDPQKAPEYQDPFSCSYTFARGWLDTLEVKHFSVAFTRTLVRSPQTQLLRRLALADEVFEEEGEYEAGDDVPEGSWAPGLYPLVRSPYLGNVRILQVGELAGEDDQYYDCHTNGEAAIGLVKKMPRLEELYLLAHGVDMDQLFGLKTLNNLRVLQVYHVNGNYPLQKLANNPSLGKLTHLLLMPHSADEGEPYIRLAGVRALVRSKNLPSLTHLQLRMTDAGDKGCEEIVASGILKRLKGLDLRFGRVGEDGARILAACPDLRNLESLNLAGNCLTQAGIRALQATGVSLQADKQWTSSGNEENDYENYLFQGDIE
jgi:uncharacterized protein (TIGR02996 family)